MVMILRLSSGTEIWIVETLLSILVLTASMLGGVRVAAPNAVWGWLVQWSPSPKPSALRLPPGLEKDDLQIQD
jgi:hypothetical protein